MTIRSPIALTAAALMLTACQPGAEEAAAPTAPAATTAAPTAAMNAAQADYKAVNDMMHAGMATIDPDADVAFMQGMAAHHQGAVAMADVALKHAKDPAVRALAERIKAAQTPEIAEMEAWLAKRGTASGAADGGAKAATAADHAAMGH